MTKASGFFEGSGRPLVIGHRGAPWQARERIEAAFRAARAAGADGVEFDVRRTGDGTLIVHHDATLADGTPIVSLSLAELFERDPEIPTFDAALEACAGLLINVEIKNWPTDPDFDTDQAVARVVALRVASMPGVVVSSFNLFALEKVRAEAPAVEVGLLGGHLPPDQVGAWITDAAARGFHGVHPEAALVTRDAVEVAHGLGLAVRVWTVDDRDHIAAMAETGVDAIITNDPAGAREVVTGIRA